MQLPNGHIYHLIVKANPPDELRQSGEYGKKELKYSVLNELLANRIAVFRYIKRFGEQLLIEKPVGFVVEKDVQGLKYTIFERVNKDDYSDNYAKDFSPDKERGNDELISRLESLEVTPTDFEIIWLRGKSVDEDRWFIVDTELWKINK